MLFAEKEMALALALVNQSTLEIRTWAADLNVFKTPTAIGQKLAPIINVKILVQEFVELMQNAEFKIIHQFACASLAMMVIRQLHASCDKSVSFG